MNATGWMEYVLVFSTQRGNLKLLAIATPHQSRQNIGSEMPIFHRDSFPPGEAKRRLRKLIPFNVPICSRRERAAKRLYHLQIVYSCNRPAKLLYFLAICQILCYIMDGATSKNGRRFPRSFLFGGDTSFTPNRYREGVLFMVTWEGLFAFCMVIIAVISLARQNRD